MHTKTGREWHLWHQRYRAHMIPSSTTEADTVIKIQSDSFSCQQHHSVGYDKARTNFGADQTKRNYPLCSFRLTKKDREKSGNWWLWLLWQSRTFFRGTQWKDKKPWTDLYQGNFWLDTRKKVAVKMVKHENMLLKSTGMSLEILQIRLDNCSHLNCPQSWFCFEQDIRLGDFIYSIILWWQKLCILECLDNREAAGTAKSLMSH